MANREQNLGSIGQRLVAIREHLRLSQKQMSARYGLGSSTWQRWEQSDEAPNPKVLEQLRREHFDIHWLLGGEGTMVRERFTHRMERLEEALRPESPEFVHVPRYDVKAAAGGGAIPDLQSPVGAVAFRRDWLHQALRVNPADLLVVEAWGDSMPGVADNGSLLLLDTSEPKFRGDGAYVFAVDDLVLVKNLKVMLDGSFEVTSTDEPQSTREVISRRDLDNVRIVGRVIWRAGRA